MTGPVGPDTIATQPDPGHVPGFLFKAGQECARKQTFPTGRFMTGMPHKLPFPPERGGQGWLRPVGRTTAVVKGKRQAKAGGSGS